MLTFFRKIRQKMFSEGRISKYLIYAIGEIFLVVIGILIALQVNDWNETRKNHSKKEKLLNALKIEFTSNKIQLDSVLYYDNKVLDGVQRLLKIDPMNPIETTNDSMPIWLQNSSYRWTFDPINGALRSGISSGQIHLIESDSLVAMLFGWQDVVADAKENEIRCIDAVIDAKFVIEKHVRALDYRYILFAELNTSRFQSDYTSLMRDPKFEDYLGERYIAMIDAVNELNLVKTQNEIILELIDSELKGNTND